MNYALMIIDLQKAYYKGFSKDSMDSACNYINAILPLFRKQRFPILWVQDKDEEDGVIPGTEGYEFISALEPLEGEYRVHKEYGNAFNKTDCAAILKTAETDLVVITGYCAEFCVLSTYRGALDLDFFPIILKDAIASGTPGNKEFVESISNIISYPILEKLLDG